ncbi:multidrug effflux MFS transporter [Gilvibacter sediminis]|uniref:multidrug effflux MFS transporter n=1 Tax=Gilvibacter sediminis TaxID=379071 RepID=UPI00234FF5F3|nr:multidrug effflux MFS transporter [Gilvibacter sediminis]MDC7998319.1 multidrug effflux MFS transporter [Gilvibacter sediminis]
MNTRRQKSQLEFVAMMAALMSIVALAIDALLPALDIIGFHVGTTNPSDNQLFIIMIFLGLGLGPLLFGPLSDSLGRKPVVYMGFALFVVASFICVSTDTLWVMILGRIIQGIGLSAPRTIAIAIIRDLYSGDYMARIMSFVTVVFLLVPIVAPAFGKLVLDAYNWQAIFYFQLGIGAVVCLWFYLRQPETLKAENKIPMSKNLFKDGFKEVIQYPVTIGCTVISGLIAGSFFVYLSGSQQIFQEQYGLKEAFPYIFAGLSIAIGLAVFSNANMVLRFGMEKLVTVALSGFFVVSFIYVLIFMGSDNPSIEILLAFMALQFLCIGFLFGNLRALAMEPVGHIAGIAAAITGFISTIMAVPISTFIGRYLKDTALPVFIGFSICSLVALLILFYLKRKNPQGLNKSAITDAT